MRTLYLQVKELDGTGGYPVQLGMVDPGDLGEIQLQRLGTLPAELPPGSPDYGAYLHALLAHGAGAPLVDFLASTDPASVVVDVRPAHLSRLPWEYLVTEHYHPFLDSNRPWSRGSWNRADPVPAALGPLRLLVVVCDPTDGSLHAEDELDGIHRAVAQGSGRIHLEVLDSPDGWPALRQQIVELAPHVVHFIGHSRQNETQTVLEFTPASAPTWELTSAVVRNSWPRGARLVVFSTCRSSRGEAASGVVALTDAVQAAGAPAVLGMRGDIRSAAAVAFAATFYASLAAGNAVDVAAAAGRRGAFDQSPGQRDWSFPVLEARYPPAQVLPIRFGVDGPDERRARNIKEFMQLSRFVDRAEQRRRTWWAIDAEGVPDRPPERSAVFITGPREGGKTWLALSSLLTCYLRGRQLQYIDLSVRSPQGATTKDWLGTLRAVRDGTPGCELSAALSPQAFARFTARLNWLVSRSPEVGMPQDAQAPVTDEWLPFDPDAGQAGRRIAMIFEDFVVALERTAKERQLVLAVDGVQAVLEDSWRDYVMPQLIAPLASGVPGVRLLLIVPDDLATRLVTDTDTVLMERVVVGGFESANIGRLIREYGVRSGWARAETQRFEQFMANRSGVIKPRTFEHFDQWLRLIGCGSG